MMLTSSGISQIVRVLHKAFTKVWKLKFSNIGALAILTYELARHHSDFATGVVDQVLEDIRAGLEVGLPVPSPGLQLAVTDHNVALPDQHLQVQPASDRDDQVPRRAALLPPSQLTRHLRRPLVAHHLWPLSVPIVRLETI